MTNVVFAERAKELLNSATNVNEKINQTLCTEFNMPSDKVSRWFKSLFGKTIREALKEKFNISRERIENALVLSTNVKEMQEMLGVKSTSQAWKGLLDREFGYSTYESAKSKFIISRKVKEYNPNRDDNLSIAISQFIGDGSFDEIRRAIRIDHGEKQGDYLIWKVSLFNKAYPNSYPISNIKKHTHTQGHIYYSWYSGNFSESTFYKIINMSPTELVQSLTPLGWCIWYLDDGGYYNYEEYKNTHKLDICICNEDLRKAAIIELNSLGLFPNEYKNGITFQSKIEIAKFLSTFVIPFKHIIPECMHYKIDMKI